MKIDRNLVKKSDITLEQKNEFKEFVLKNVHVDEPKGFQAFLANRWTFWLSLIGSIVLVITLGVYSKNSYSISSFGLISFIVAGIILITTCIFSWKIRKKVTKQALSQIELLPITKKWFSFYGVKESNVEYASNELPIRQIVSRHRNSPSDARVASQTKAFSIINGGIQTIFKGVTWHWTRTYSTKNGTRTTHYYRDQFFTFDFNFREKWDNLQFFIYQGKSILNRKKENLENETFNKKFKYEYNDPILLRQLFTPSVQESLVNSMRYSQTKIIKDGKVLITTIENTRVSSDFTPFQLNITTAIKEDILKKKIADDLLTDFELLMKFMAQTRMLYPIFKK